MPNLARAAAAAMFTVAMLAASAASAGDVYVNGVKVTPGQLAGTVLTGATVRLQANGDVQIEAPHYKVTEVAANPPAPVAPAAAPPPVAVREPIVDGRWYAVVQMPVPDHYIVQVATNGVRYPQVKGSAQRIIELTQDLRPGANTVEVTLLPVPGATGAVGQRAVDVLVGRGREAADGALEITEVSGKVLENTGNRTATAHPIVVRAEPRRY